jgi:glycosyltransferase involved in cell wall biosynthesis
MEYNPNIDRFRNRRGFIINTTLQPSVEINRYGEYVKKESVETPKKEKKELVKQYGRLDRIKKEGENKHIEIKENPVGFSIIIPAYKADFFIHECLDSIEKQSYFINNNEYEILVGVDNCVKTLEKIIEIKNNYRNLNVFMMNINVGPYVVKNTLIPLTKYDNLIFFDSDDIMELFLIEVINKNIKTKKTIRFGYTSFGDINKKGHRYSADGVFFAKKSIFDVVGYYEGWRCGADTDFRKRVSKHCGEYTIKEYLFKRRHHPTSLTKSKETSGYSQIRKKYSRIINNKNYNKLVRVEPITCNFKKID